MSATSRAAGVESTPKRKRSPGHALLNCIVAEKQGLSSCNILLCSLSGNTKEAEADHMTLSTVGFLSAVVGKLLL
jgi:hypothetical protein